MEKLFTPTFPSTMGWILIAASAIINIFLGFVWYSLIFGDLWEKEMRKDKNIPKDEKWEEA